MSQCWFCLQSLNILIWIWLILHKEGGKGISREYLWCTTTPWGCFSPPKIKVSQEPWITYYCVLRVGVCVVHRSQLHKSVFTETSQRFNESSQKYHWYLTQVLTLRSVATSITTKSTCDYRGNGNGVQNISQCLTRLTRAGCAVLRLKRNSYDNIGHKIIKK